MSTTTVPAYDDLASVYDLLVDDAAYGRWLARLVGLATEHGLTGRRVLDVACGTGHSYLPLLDEGWAVSACDLSPEMVARARERSGGAAALHVADMRALPVLGAFDLVTCLNDSVNHLLDRAELVAALTGMAANLAPGGLLVFDVNTPLAYRRPGDVAVEDEDRFAVWRGGAAHLAHPGAQTTVRIELFERVQGDLWRRRLSTQPHRHHPTSVIAAAVADAGLALRAVRGQRVGGVLEAEVDEAVHHKAVFVAGLPVSDAEGGAR